MKNMKNSYLYGSNQADNKSYNKRKSHSLCRSIAEERLCFKDGAPLGSLPITVEDGQTKRIVRRIVEKLSSMKRLRERNCLGCKNPE